MEGQKQEFIYPKLVLDSQGYTQSFDINDYNPKEVSQFFDKYGVVIFNNIINQEQIQTTIDDLWADIQSRCGKELDRKDKTSWKFQGWRGAYGFVNGMPLKQKQICKNRHNQKVYQAFKTLYEGSSGKPLEQPLIAMFDRGSGMRPCKHNPQWLTNDIYHFDINPWWWTNVVKTTKKDWRRNDDYVPDKFVKWLSQGNKVPYNGYTKIAGVLALTDTNQTSGGFQCVCGFQKYIKQWCRKTQPNTEITQDQNLMKNFQKIFQRKGSLLLFSRQLPHNIFKNFSEQWRFAQYLRMSPLSSLMLTQFQIEKRRKCVLQLLPKDLPVEDKISREVYMLN